MYKGILFAPDGDYVTDYKGKLAKEVEEQLANRGSRWYFYPFEGVILDKGSISPRQRLVSVAFPFEDFKGRTVGTFRKFLSELTSKDLNNLL